MPMIRTRRGAGFTATSKTDSLIFLPFKKQSTVDGLVKSEKTPALSCGPIYFAPLVRPPFPGGLGSGGDYYLVIRFERLRHDRAGGRRAI